MCECDRGPERCEKSDICVSVTGGQRGVKRVPAAARWSFKFHNRTSRKHHNLTRDVGEK